MKKFTVLALLAFSWYIAGKYRQIPMTVLLTAEVFLLVIMFVLPRYFRRILKFGFLGKNQTVQKGEESFCSVHVNNKGRLPVNKLNIKIKFAYQKDKQTVLKKKLDGSAACGNKNLLEFGFKAPYCGMIDASLESVRIYDYLSIFSSYKRLKAEMKIAVFPSERALHIELPSFGQDENNPVTEMIAPKSGDDHNDIRQIREYHPGDSIRLLHRNYSAKTGELWIKEYEREKDFRLDLILDTSDIQKKTAEERDAFYEILSAVVLGLLQNQAIVRVYWHDDSQTGIYYMDVETAGQCKEMLYRLYDTIFEQKQTEHLPTAVPNVEAMKFNLDLEWCFNDKLIYRFSKTRWNDEISQITFVI